MIVQIKDLIMPPQDRKNIGLMLLEPESPTGRVRTASLQCRNLSTHLSGSGIYKADLTMNVSRAYLALNHCCLRTISL